MDPLTVSRVATNQWHAVENDLVVGRGHASRRLDGRTFLSIDTWRVFALANLNGLELRPRRVLLWQVFTRWLYCKTENATRTSENMYLHMLLHSL